MPSVISFALCYYANAPTFQTIVEIVVLIDSIFALSAIFFYFAVSTLTIELLRQMRIDIGNVNESHRFLVMAAYVPKMEFHLKKWRHRYLILSQLVESINQCFGAILLHSTVFFFCMIINEFFFSIILFRDAFIPHFPIHLYKLLKWCAYLVGMTSVASKMKNEVSFEKDFF